MVLNWNWRNQYELMVFNGYTDIYAQMEKKRLCTHIYNFKLCLLREPRNNQVPVTMSAPAAQILISKYHSLIKRTKSLEKWPILELGREIYKINVEHLVVPEYKSILVQG